MKRIYTLFKICVLMLLFIFASVQAPDLHERYLISEVGPSVLMLTPVDNFEGGGTGFQINTPQGPKILSNAHVCEGVGGKYAMAHYTGGKEIVRIERLDDITDLCLLSPVGGLSVLDLSEDEPQLHDTIGVLGHPLLAPQTLSLGRIRGSQIVEVVVGFLGPEGCKGPGGHSEVIFCLRPYVAMLTTARIFPGNSGSPAFNFWGEVVGIVFASNTVTNYGIIIPLKDIKRFIREGK